MSVECDCGACDRHMGIAPRPAPVPMPGPRPEPSAPPRPPAAPRRPYRGCLYYLMPALLEHAEFPALAGLHPALEEIARVLEKAGVSRRKRSCQLYRRAADDLRPAVQADVLRAVLRDDPNLLVPLREHAEEHHPAEPRLHRELGELGESTRYCDRDHGRQQMLALRATHPRHPGVLAQALALTQALGLVTEADRQRLAAARGSADRTYETADVLARMRAQVDQPRLRDVFERLGELCDAMKGRTDADAAAKALATHPYVPKRAAVPPQQQQQQ